MRRLVIIGNSAAGLAAIEAIRSRDRQCSVTLVAAEPHLPYSRVMLTYLLAGKVRRDELFLHGADWYARMGVEALVGHRAVEIDTRREQVVVERSSPVPRAACPPYGKNTRRLAYDRLLIATGALAQRPALPGIDLPGVFCLRDLDDAVAILRYAEDNRLLAEPGRAKILFAHRPRAVFLGGGPVCLQALAALTDRGMNVTLVVRSRSILSQLADPYTAGLAEKVLRAHGVRVLTEAEPVGIDARSNRPGARILVHVRDGRRLPADMVIIGKGTQPNLELARGTDIATDVGILVDETMETSVPCVFAAGDVAQAMYCVSGRKVYYGTWSNACEQGRIAGLNMAGSRTEWTGGLNRNITTLFGNTLGSVGVVNAEADGDGPVCTLHSYRDRRRDVSRRLLFRDGRCEGAVLWNACDDLGVLGSLISTRRDCSGWEDRLTRGGTSFADTLRMTPARCRQPALLRL